jgi:hypothetical protein
MEERREERQETRKKAYLASASVDGREGEGREREREKPPGSNTKGPSTSAPPESRIRT